MANRSGDAGGRREQDAGPPLTRSQAVAAALRELIRIGEYPPGTRLLQAEVAQRFGVSTTPAREAFTALAREGLVRHDPHRGVVVFKPSRAELDENYEIRGALERLATELAAPRLSKADFQELDQNFAEMSRVGEPDGLPLDQGPDLNRDFHATIYEAAGRPRLLEIIENLRESATSYLGLTVQRPDHDYRRRALAEHAEIIAALKAGSAQKAGQLMERHLRNNQLHVAALIENPGE